MCTTRVLTLHPRDGISCRHKAARYIYVYSSSISYLFHGRRYTHGRLPGKKNKKYVLVCFRFVARLIVC